MMKKNIAFLLLFLLALVTQAQNYVFNSKYNNYTTQSPAPNYNNVYAMTTAPNGNLIVVDYGSAYVYILSSAGSLISEFGGPGTTNGKFSTPSGVAVDGSGNIYVVDRGNHRIQKFTSLGVYTSQWGTLGTGNGQFSSPFGITINGTLVYVTDMANNRVQYFNLSGTYQGQFGTGGTGNGQLNGPAGIVTDASGNVYVSDRLNNRIQKFNSTGIYSLQWGTLGTADGQLNNPLHLKSDGTYIYVVDYNNNRIQKFNTSGVFQLKWGTLGASDNEFTNPKAITISAGNIVVVDAYYFKTYTSAGVFVSKFSARKEANGQFNSPTDITLDPSGNIYVLDAGNNRIQKLASNGDYVAKHNYGDYVAAIAMDNNGTSIYQVRRNDGELFRSPAPGSIFGGTIGNFGTGNGQFSNPIAMAVDNGGNLYVLEEGNRRVQKLGAGDNYLTKWGSSGTGDGQFLNLRSIAVDNLGNVFVAEANRIQKFSNTGTFISKWGTAGSGNGQFVSIKDIACDVQGNVYVVDGTRVQKFDGNGNFITSFGSSGSADGQFANTTGIYVDATGKVYVVDGMNNNVQTFVTDKEIKVVQGSTEIVSGTGVYDFGSITMPANSGDITFTISNEGSLPLTLSGSPAKVSLLGGNASDFTLVQTSVPGSLSSGATATFTVRFTPSAVGARTTTLIIASNDTDENPYTITLTGNGKSNQTITPGGNVSAIYGDAAFTPVSTASSGLGLSYSSGNTAVATVSGTVITIVGAGTSVITVSQAGNTSFNAAPDQTFTLTVTKATLSVLVDNKSRVTGDANPAFTYTLSGFVNGDNTSVVSGAPVLSCSATTGSAAGDYDITVTLGTLSAANYDFLLTNGVLTVSPATGVAQANYAQSISLYPNPSNGDFTIDTDDQLQQVTVFDAIGRKEVYTGIHSFTTEFKGLLVLEVVTNKGTAYLKAIVK